MAVGAGVVEASVGTLSVVMIIVVVGDGSVIGTGITTIVVVADILR